MFPFFTLLTISITSIFTPGPNNIMMMTLGNRYGFADSMKYGTGVLVGYFFAQLVAAFLNLYLHTVIPQITDILAIIGSGYLCFLAFSTLKSKKTNKNSENIDKDKLFWIAIPFQFVNPKAMLFSITIYSSFILPYFQSIPILLLFTLFFCTLTGIALVMWSICGVVLDKIIHKYQFYFNAIMSLFLLYAAFSIIQTASFFQ